MQTIKRSRLFAGVVLMAVVLVMGQGQAGAADIGGPGAGVQTGTMTWPTPVTCNVPCVLNPTTWHLAASGPTVASIADAAQVFVGTATSSISAAGSENPAVGTGTASGTVSGVQMMFTGSGVWARVGAIIPIVLSGSLCINNFCVDATLVVVVTATVTATVSLPPPSLTVTLSATASVFAALGWCIGPRPPC